MSENRESRYADYGEAGVPGLGARKEINGQGWVLCHVQSHARFWPCGVYVPTLRRCKEIAALIANETDWTQPLVRLFRDADQEERVRNMVYAPVGQMETKR